MVIILAVQVDDLSQEGRFQQGSWNLKDGQDICK